MELRSLLESGFAPLACECLLGEASLSVRVYDPESGRVDLMVTGIALNLLHRREGALRLLEELREELESNTLKVERASGAR
ncbi:MULTISPECIES: DUF1652 domain-containing protein [Pseudomonas]|uniref:DUF1652 domain-containing protein n=1 Tax=Pseudomonas gingeri TaxID=117681 RepID=A0A7Y7WMX2_9PSED|nr:MULTISPECIES: DUF1652 domain-containing protein [Pseudomonas]MPQ67770.1 DUF1652 domain-containing protein [Pseudomonas sp. MWU12-2323]NWB84010.1 DUF1652 domain-containing protein [Pseudomonas gingeri]RBH57313.1 DUF1652 domain-containing protein [Pseudomonas sp. MWU13-2860]